MWIVSRSKPEATVWLQRLLVPGPYAKTDCRSDPLPFILLSEDPSLCRDTQFVDIDYEKLMINKKTAIKRTAEITQVLKDIEFLSDESAVQIRSAQYLGIGCDLKNLKKLDDVLRTEVLPAECSVLFLAEVSLTYMDVKSANAVVEWASKLNNGTVTILCGFPG